MDLNYILKFMSVMIAMMLADVCWTLYFMKIAEKKAAQAAAWGSIIILFGAISTTSYVDDHSLIVAAVIGAFIGTYATIKYKNNKESNEKIDNKATAL